MHSFDLLKEAIHSSIEPSEVEFDEDFQSVVSYMEKEQLSKAVEIIESSLEEKRLDIRLINYYFHACIAKDGLLSMSEIFSLLHTLLDEHWENLSPATKRERHTQNSLKWFFSRQLKTLEGINRSHLKKDFGPYNRYTEGFDSNTITEIVHAADTLRQTLLDKMSDASLANQVLHISKAIRELERIQPESNEEEEIEEMEESAPAEKSPRFFFSSKKKAKEVKKQSASVETERTSSIPPSALEPSAALEAFYKKIQAFKALIERGDYQKAAVIAEDIDKQLENFDPVIFFPKLFVEYYSMYAKNASQIDERRDFGSLKLLQKLYDADLDAFVNW